ncbi:hypothetical protein IFR04_001516 [Cadophora malorum]|uniref:Ysc84 actin-binding domain-containing protein n=1 Tax=Cadophora malorum TaxID=108018 RepID=A0A8H7WI67_9HELO|nr:hypothetical protein IFR04_001516 [Cadophora malorum]
MPVWEKTKHSSKAAFDKGWAAFEKLGAPVNKLTNKIGSEAFWPQGLGPESDKAARILKSFCSEQPPPPITSSLTETEDGFYKDEPVTNNPAVTGPAAPGPAMTGAVPASGAPAGPPTPGFTSTPSEKKPTSPGPKNKPKVLVKIPQKVIQNCVGLAVFTVMRTGLWVSGAGGSGVLIARKEDGNWGPPSGILIHTLGVGFMAGIDIYDCVIVINNRKALEAFKTMRVSLGGELSVVAGPLGAGGVLEAELVKNSKKPIFSYVKSRGLYGGLQIDGTIIVERNDENAKFYGERLPISNILAGQVKNIPRETRMLAEVVKQAEGRTDVDPVVLEQASHVPPPSDLDVEKMSEPTQDQKNNFAPPPHYDPAHMGVAGSVSHDEKHGYGAQAYPGQTHGDNTAFASQHTGPTPAYNDPNTFNPQQQSYQPPPQGQTGFSQQPQTPTGTGPTPFVPHAQSSAAHTPAVDSDGFPTYDPTLYDATPHTTGNQNQNQHPNTNAGMNMATDPYPQPLGQHPTRTDSGFAAPPGPPPGHGVQRTDSGFPGPPPRSPRRDEKQDPDGPPRYA